MRKMGLFDFKKTEKKPSKKKEKVEVEEDEIVFRTIIELLGSPKSYIEKTMKAYVGKIKSNSDYKVVNVKISKPQKVKKVDEETIKLHNVKEDLFSSFAELEIAVKKKARIRALIGEGLNPQEISDHSDILISNGYVRKVWMQLHDEELVDRLPYQFTKKHPLVKSKKSKEEAEKFVPSV